MKRTEQFSGAEKAIKVLLSFVPSNREIRNLDLSEELEFNVSTVNRNLKILRKNGLIQQNPFTKEYSLGPAAAELGKAYRKSMSSRMIEISEPHMIALRDATNETIALVVEIKGVFYITKEIRSKSHVNVKTFPPGSSPPWNISASSKIILAYSDMDLVRRYLKETMKRFTRNTIITKKAYLETLEQARRDGVAYDRCEHWEDVYAVAAPIFDSENRVVASIAVVGPEYRMKPLVSSKIVPELKKTARSISAQIAVR